jgi:hypothetical protein
MSKKFLFISISIFVTLLISLLFIKYNSFLNETFINSNDNTIYAIITTCLLEQNYDLRKEQYTRGITSFLDSIQKYKNIKPVIVENNSKTETTFLNDFGIPVLYTHNNDIEKCAKDNNYKGYIEIKDVHDCIKHFNIKDTDFIVKFTGRYIIEPNSEFMNELLGLNSNKYDSIILFGHYQKPVTYKMEDCVTGLIGMRTLYVKQITYNYRPIENDWAKIALSLPDEKLCILRKLGVKMCPGQIDGYYSI